MQKLSTKGRVAETTFDLMTDENMGFYLFAGTVLGTTTLGHWVNFQNFYGTNNYWSGTGLVAGLVTGVLGYFGTLIVAGKIAQKEQERLEVQDNLESRLEETQTIEPPIETPKENEQTTVYQPIKVTRKNPFGIGYSLSFGEIERSNILVDLTTRLRDHLARQGRQINYTFNEPQIDTNGIKADGVFFETDDGVISGSIVYMPGQGFLRRGSIRTVVHFNSDDGEDMREYLGIHKLLEGLTSKQYSNEKVEIPKSTKKYGGKGTPPAAR